MIDFWSPPSTSQKNEENQQTHHHQKQTGKHTHKSTQPQFHQFVINLVTKIHTYQEVSSQCRQEKTAVYVGSSQNYSPLTYHCNRPGAEMLVLFCSKTLLQIFKGNTQYSSLSCTLTPIWTHSSTIVFLLAEYRMNPMGKVVFSTSRKIT